MIARVLAGEARWHVEQGDCLDVLRALPDASVDAVVTDPPYELGFMGKRWDASGVAYRVDLWHEVLRVLRPGGHLLAFGGTRTSHRMTCAIEDAGFEIRDSIHWVYGSGFPKSHDVSKAIDRDADVTREVVGSRRLTGTARIVGGQGGATSGRSAEMYETHATRDTLDLTAPATDAARQWSGWGTALKPAHEPIVVARKPLVGTVASNVLAHGTGAINVDACRVGTTGGGTHCTNRDEHGRCLGHDNAGRTTSGETVHGPDTTAGRWPPNFVMSHLPECREVGVRTIRGTNPQGTDRGSALGRMNDDGWQPRERKIIPYAQPDGTETVPAFDCAPGCPVAEMDAQSGERAAGVAVNRNRAPGTMSSWMGTRASQTGDDVGYGDSGGASRFFPCFTYQAKASRRERNAGTPDGNRHVCVKPLDLMRWLVRLVTPPGGVVIDPFAGSGSTGAAAVSHGYRFVGIEREAEYVEIARARIAHHEAAPAPKPKRAPKSRATPAPRVLVDERQPFLFDLGRAS